MVGSDWASHPPPQGTLLPGRTVPPPQRQSAPLDTVTRTCPQAGLHPAALLPVSLSRRLVCVDDTSTDSSVSRDTVPVRDTPLFWPRQLRVHCTQYTPAPRIPASGGFSFQTTDAARQWPAWVHCSPWSWPWNDPELGRGAPRRLRPDCWVLPLPLRGSASLSSLPEFPPGFFCPPCKSSSFGDVDPLPGWPRSSQLQPLLCWAASLLDQKF